MPDFESEFERLFREHHRRVLRAAYSLLKDWQKADDIAQKVFLDVFERMKRGETIEHPRAFLERHTWFKCMDTMKKEDREKPFENLDSLRPVLIGPPDSDGAEERPDALESLAFWLARLIEIATEGAPPKQHRRLLVLVSSRSRVEALAMLALGGDQWKKTAVSTTLNRYSQKIDLYLNSLHQSGPTGQSQKDHWPFFMKLYEWSSAISDPDGWRRSTLSELIRGAHRLGPVEHKDLIELVESNLNSNLG